jgi:uncharacterized delta-60 repeat protein
MLYPKILRVRRTLIAVTLTLILVACLPARRAQAAAGDLDPTFGTGGKVITGPPGPLSTAHAVVLQPDGKIVVAGNAFDPIATGINFGLARYNPNGSLDTSFGTAGVVTTDFSNPNDQANAIALQPDGKIIAAGITYSNATRFDFALARYNPNGSLDTSFGNGGKVVTTLSALDDSIHAIALQADGRIVVAGSHALGIAQIECALARYNANGSLDMTFGTGGIVFTKIFGGDEANAVAIQNTGKILVAGGAAGANFLLRYETNGSLDASFGSGGLIVDFVNGVSGVRAMVLQNDQKIVLAGDYFDSSQHFLLIRHNPDGSLDSSFGANGVVSGPFSSPFTIGAAVAVAPNGKIVVGGSVRNNPTTDFALARYNPNGSLDTTFGTGGMTTTDFFGSFDDAFAVAIQPDDKVILAGSAVNNDHLNLALARYDGGSSFDLCLQDDGNGNGLQVNSTTGEYIFTNCRKGFTVSGIGTVHVRGCKLELQSVAANHRLSVLVNTCSHVATASLKISSISKTLTIADSDITNNACSCR